MNSESTDQQGNIYIQQSFVQAQDLQSAGIEMEKSWSAVDDGKDCESCKKNEQAGWIPLNQAFPSGHQIPLAHAGCRCDLRIRRKKEETIKIATPTTPKKRIPFIVIAIIALVAFCIFCIIASFTMDAMGLIPTPAPTTIQPPATNTSLPPTQVSRCILATSQQIELLRQGIKAIEPNNDVLQGFAVRSNDFERVWFVSAEITGAGIEPKQAIGLWAMAGEPEFPTGVLSINGFALNFSDWFDGTKTEAQMTMFDDGAQEALTCAMNN